MRTLQEIQRKEKVGYRKALEIQRQEIGKMEEGESADYLPCWNRNQSPELIEALRSAFRDGFRAGVLFVQRPLKRQTSG